MVWSVGICKILYVVCSLKQQYNGIIPHTHRPDSRCTTPGPSPAIHWLTTQKLWRLRTTRKTRRSGKLGNSPIAKRWPYFFLGKMAFRLTDFTNLNMSVCGGILLFLTVLHPGFYAPHIRGPQHANGALMATHDWSSSSKVGLILCPIHHFPLLHSFFPAQQQIVAHRLFSECAIRVWRQCLLFCHQLLLLHAAIHRQIRCLPLLYIFHEFIFWCNRLPIMNKPQRIFTKFVYKWMVCCWHFLDEFDVHCCCKERLYQDYLHSHKKIIRRKILNLREKTQKIFFEKKFLKPITNLIGK